MTVGDALQGVLMLLLLIGVGFFAARRGLLSEEFEESLSRLALRIAIPALLFENTISYISVEFVKGLGWLALVPPVSMLLVYALGLAAIRVFRIPRSDRGVFLVMFALSNSIFIGLPVALAIFGEQAMPYVVTYFPANTVVFWTLGNLGIARDAGGQPGSPLAVVRQVLSPPLLGFLAGLAVVLAGGKSLIPGFVNQGLSYLGGMTVPVSLLTTGAVLSRMGRDALRVGRVGVLVILGRMVLAPGLTLVMCLLAGAPGLLTSVFTMISCMPVMSQCVIMARLYGANHRLAAQMLTLTTLLALVWIPLWVLVLQLTGG